MIDRERIRRDAGEQLADLWEHPAPRARAERLARQLRAHPAPRAERLARHCLALLDELGTVEERVAELEAELALEQDRTSALGAAAADRLEVVTEAALDVLEREVVLEGERRIAALEGELRDARDRIACDRDAYDTCCADRRRLETELRRVRAALKRVAP